MDLIKKKKKSFLFLAQEVNTEMFSSQDPSALFMCANDEKVKGPACFHGFKTLTRLVDGLHSKVYILKVCERFENSLHEILQYGTNAYDNYSVQMAHFVNLSHTQSFRFAIRKFSTSLFSP